MKILVTGCSGYVGSSLALELLRSGHDVIGIDKVVPGPHLNGIRFIEHDIRNPLTQNASLQGAIGQIEVVFHAAALAYVGESFDRPAEYAVTNIIGTQNVLNWMLDERIMHLVFTSSCSVLEGSSSPIAETDGFAPLSPYAMSKLSNENQIELWAKASGGTYGIARFFNVAGVFRELIGDKHDPEPHLIPRTVTALLSDRPLVVNGTDFPTRDGSAVRDYVHIQDLVNGLIALMTYSREGHSGTFNLGSGVGHSVLEVIDTATRTIDVVPKIVLGPRRPGDAPQLVADISAARDAFGFSPENSELSAILKQQVEIS